MIPSENPQTSWEVTITHDELMSVMGNGMAIGRRETGSSVVWMTKVPSGPRLWIMRDGVVVTWISARSSVTDPLFALPMPESFVASMLFASEDEEDVTLTYNKVDGTLVGRTTTRTVATDLPVDVEFTPFDLPYRHQEDAHHRNPAVATVSLRDLNYFAMMAHDIPRGLKLADNPRSEERMHPHVSIAIGNGKMAWTTDWRRHGLGRSTAVVPARTTGSLTAMFYPYQAARIIGTKDPDQDARIFIDGPDADYVYIVGDDWGIRVQKEFEEVNRWRGSLTEAIVAAGHTMGGHGHHFPNNKVAFMAGDSPCHASIIVDDSGVSESIRLTCIVGEAGEPTLENLTRLNELNNGLVGAQVVLRDEQVEVVTQFPASLLPDIGLQLAMFTAAVDNVGPLLDLLPLFSGGDPHVVG